VGQLAPPEERPGDLQEAEAHQIRAKRHAEEDDPAWKFQVGRDLAGRVKLDHKLRAHRADDEGEERSGEQAEQHDLGAPLRLQHVDQNVDADVDAGAHAIGGAELRHPDEHVDADLLRPGQVDVVENRIEPGDADRVALHDGDENDQSRPRDQGGDEELLEPVENSQDHLRLARFEIRLGRRLHTHLGLAGNRRRQFAVCQRLPSPRPPRIARHCNPLPLERKRAPAFRRGPPFLF